MPIKCWTIVGDNGPAFKRRWFNVSCHLSQFPVGVVSSVHDIFARTTLRLLANRTHVPAQEAAAGVLCLSSVLLFDIRFCPPRTSVIRFASITQAFALTWTKRTISADTIRWTNARLMLVQRRRRWVNINPALVQRLLLIGHATCFILPRIPHAMLVHRFLGLTSFSSPFDFSQIFKQAYITWKRHS